MSKIRFPVLVLAGLCFVGAAWAETEASVTTSTDVVDARVTADEASFRTDVQDEHWRHDGVGEHERNMVRSEREIREEVARVEDIDSDDVTVFERGNVDQRQVAGTTTEVRQESQVATTEQATTVARDGDTADRCNPPFADLGRMDGQCEALADPAAIENDKLLLVRGERRGDELIIDLPQGTHRDTLSLRSGTGLDISRAEFARLSRWVDDDTVALKIADLEANGKLDTSDLWVWGTGPESGSLLQRVKMEDLQVATSDTEDTRVQ